MLHKSEEKKDRALQKHLSEWCIKGDHLLKKCKKCFVKVKKKKVWALQKLLSEGCIKGDHLLKNQVLSDQYIHFYGWFSDWCYGENVNVGLT